MKQRIRSVALLHLAACALCAIPILSAIAADELPEVSVSAVRVRQATKEVLGRSAIGAPQERISLSRSVRFSDLDLTTPSGAAELEKRVKETAKLACEALDELLPLSPRGGPECAAEAAKGGMAKAHAVIAAAEKKAGQPPKH